MTEPDRTPFADGAGCFECGGLTVENGTEAIALYGQVDITRDRAGLARARELLGFLQAAVALLEGQVLPERVAAAKPKGAAKNPFS